MKLIVNSHRVSNGFFIFLILLSVLAFRRYDIFVNPQLWAEDGPVFIQQYYEKGILSFVTPYAGYFHTIQRLIVAFWGVAGVNLIYIPTLYCATIIALLFYVTITIWKDTQLLNIQNGVAYSLSFAIVPVTSDIFLNITNLNGMLSLYLIHYLFVRKALLQNGTKLSIAQVVFIAILVLSGPTSVILSPIVLLILFIERRSLSLQRIWPLILLLLGGLIQVYAMTVLDKGFIRSVDGTVENFHLLKFFTNNIGDLLFMQYGFWPDLNSNAQFSVQIIALVLFALFIYKCYKGIENREKYIIGLAILLYLASVVKAYWPKEQNLYAMRNASRYFVVPYTCFAWLIILAFDRKIGRLTYASYLAFLLLQSKYIKFELADKHWKDEMMEYRDGKREIIDINPEGWKFGLPPMKK